MSEKETSSTGVHIVRPSSRRKFLVGLLGGGAILAAGTPGLLQLAQNVRVAWNTKPYPYNLLNNNDDLIGDSYSPDLNFMAMIKVHDDGPAAQLYIWDYQQQRMTTLPTGSESGTSSWGPDNRRLLFQSQTSLDLWDVQMLLSHFQRVCERRRTSFLCSPQAWSASLATFSRRVWPWMSSHASRCHRCPRQVKS